ncbi:Protein slyX [Bibersteinia trehalosi USDA-ARS-USMARC-188]|uniref:Protein SlyX homolog n=3 Tax=Bibersteinia trehalosi TaxID=47735 RepID=A0A4V7ICI3_BIBTR|nr:Protein slyX [Bibersteinia trehalosi USDA-ARS-USMARC-192]AHG82753.1 Protein slyX [Bibersteinia trehalosi USDA-ARS-USMARC-188]AHG85089.1 Protein slyX [Bibersteinia trehalosi USDA-ARS-USMARC-189]
MYFCLKQPILRKMSSNNTKLQQYLIELETKVAFQEQTIEELNQALIHQQFALDKLQLQVRNLAEKLQGLSSSNVASRSEETPPPHY